MKKHFKTSRSFKEIVGILTIKHLAYILGEKPQILQSIATNADEYYRPFTEQQGSKQRRIDNPTGVLKDVQTKIGNRLLDVYPLCDIIFGAVPEHDTRMNAALHTRQKVVVRLDLKDCFHSTKKLWVYNCFRKQFRYSHQVATLLSNLCTYNDSVPVGSPLSSTLVNVVYDPLWRTVKAYCESQSHRCGIWVDDVIISGHQAEKLIPEVKRLINKRGLRIGWKKLKIQRNHLEAQEVTGNTVNSEIGVPIRKRREYAKILKQAQTDPKLFWKAQGRLAHAKFVNRKQGKQLGKLMVNE